MNEEQNVETRKDDERRSETMTRFDVASCFWRARKEKHLSMQKISDVSGISKNTLYEWSSARNIPNVLNFIKLCEALDMTPNEFLGIKDGGLR